jgi:hypothetical protein
VLGLVVGWDGDIHVWQWRVSVAEGNGRDVDISRLLDGLVVSPRVSQKQKAWLFKVLLNLIGKGSCKAVEECISTEWMGDEDRDLRDEVVVCRTAVLPGV